MGADWEDYNIPPNNDCIGKRGFIVNQQYPFVKAHFPVNPSSLSNGVHGEFYASVSGTEGNIPDWDLDALRSQIVEVVLPWTSLDPPEYPNDYARYIVPVGATGRWFGKGNHIAFCLADPRTNNGRWVFRNPAGGELVFSKEGAGPADWLWKIYNADAGEWQPLLQHALNSPYHTDVEITSPQDGDVLVYDLASEKWKNQQPSFSHRLKDHLDAYWTDPVINAYQDYVITWDKDAGGSGIPGFKLAAVPRVLDDLLDVDAPSPSANDFLRSDGTNWVASPFGLADIPVGSNGDVLTTSGGSVVWAAPSGGGGGGSGLPQLHGIGITYADNIVGSYVRKDTTTPQIRWQNPGGGVAYYSTAGMGFGNILIPSGYSRAIFYCRLSVQDELNGWGLAAILRGAELAAVKKNGSNWDFVPEGLFGPGGDHTLSNPGATSSTAGPWLNRVNYLSQAGVFMSMPVDVVAAEVWAISLKWREKTDLTWGSVAAGSDTLWTVSGGPGNGNLPTISGNPYTLFDEWGVYLYE